MIYGSVQFYIKYQAVCLHTVIYQLLPLVVQTVSDSDSQHQNEKFLLTYSYAIDQLDAKLDSLVWKYSKQLTNEYSALLIMLRWS